VFQPDAGIALQLNRENVMFTVEVEDPYKTGSMSLCIVNCSIRGDKFGRQNKDQFLGIIRIILVKVKLNKRNERTRRANVKRRSNG
jgi:hypothetical protein